MKNSAEKYRSFLSYILIFLGTFLVMQIAIGTAMIPSHSMDPTLTVGKKYLFFQQAYLFSDPKRGDIIVFDDFDQKSGGESSEDSQRTIFCKRIIGVPGDVIDFKDESVYINGERLDEPYAYGVTMPFVRSDENGNPYIADHFEVPEGHYFFMGDNRENSHDSRLWKPQPFIEKSQILGKLIVF